jgi:hypothetical protein
MSQPTDYESAKIVRDEINASWDKVCQDLKSYPKGSMGLTLDSAKDSRWHSLMKQSDNHRKQLQNFNRVFVKKFKKEILQERKEKRGYQLSQSSD